MSAATNSLSMPIPPEVVALCRRLHEAGYPAYVVGGAVRDLLRRAGGDSDLSAKDFDVATSALPEEVARIFGPRRTIPTGIAHGTVTVLCEHEGEKRPRPVEVTTFRGETGYSDGRRPDRVEFIGDLVEDLRRRDFTINAIAYEPLSGTLHDPFDGQGDLSRRLIRAVGDATQRFAEDGLRLLRAVRFAAQLGFTIDPSTRAAFAGALPTLRKVSRERVRDELLRLLAAPRPSLGLSHMIEPWPDGAGVGLLGVVLPELAAELDAAQPGSYDAWMALIDAASPSLRLATCLWPLRHGAAEPKSFDDRLDELLKLPTQERQHLLGLLRFPEPDYKKDAPWPDPTVRRFMASHPEALVTDFLALRQLTLGPAVADLAELAARIRDERAQKPPLRTADLAVSGKDLMSALGLRPGPAVGDTLRYLLEQVLDDPRRNQKEVLLEQAKLYLKSSLPTSA
jgi:tRNA nucleotidyltransferase (CCA-adding enzyme)